MIIGMKMSNLRVEQIEAVQECRVKRFYFPAVLTSTCPVCGKDIVKDGRNDYISYPSFNLPQKVYFCHEAEVFTDDGEVDYLEHEWEETIVLKLVVEEISHG